MSFRTLLQSFRRDGVLGVLNVLGLSVGITMSVLVVWYIRFNVAYDTHHPDRDNIYRLVSKDINDGHLSFGNPLPMAEAIRNDYPGEGIVAGMSLPYDFQVTVNHNEFTVKASTADAGIFKILDFRLLPGSSEDALREPNNAIITESCARRLFGSEDPIGKPFTLMSFNGEVFFTVSGVMIDPPGSSEFTPEMLLSWQSTNPVDWRDKWWWGGTAVFIRVTNDKQRDDLEKKINTILERHHAPYILGRYEYQLLPLKESHFRTDIENAFSPAVSSRLLWALRIIATIIIAVACINFINLASSQSEKNLKDTGIRKLSGASQNRLVVNFLSLNLLKAFSAMLPAVVLVAFLSEPFKNLANMDSTTPFSDPVTWILIVVMVLVISIISGVFPAVSVARKTIISILYNRRDDLTTQVPFRKTLVVFQLVIANILILVSLFIIRQISFMKNHDLGFDSRGLFALSISDLDLDSERKIEKAGVLEEEIKKRSTSAGITGICETEAIPGLNIRNKFTVYEIESWNTFSVISIGIDEDFSAVFGIPVLEGKNFGHDIASEREAVLINETFLHQLGWESVHNKQLALFNKEFVIPVLGVMRDVHISSLTQAIPPMIYRYKENAYPEYMVFRIRAGMERESQELIEAEWHKIAGEEPCSIISIKDNFRSMYGSEERLLKIIGIFCVIAIILSCFGILAHISYEIQRRTKEIGIRKVFGAKTGDVLSLNYRDIVKWLILSSLVAFPVAYYMLTRWLDNFAYKATISWWLFILAFLLSFGISIAIITFQTWGTAKRNPAETLKYE
jgi:putative ABC transport system permease protein